MNVLERFAEKILHRNHKAVLIVAMNSDGSIYATEKGDPLALARLPKLEAAKETEGG